MIIFQTGEPDVHATAAVRAAQASRQQTTVANRDGGAIHPAIHVNIGISSGVCEVGATRLHGAAGERWTFTASGPVTNLAARLSDHADDGQIFLTSETARRVCDRFPVRSLGPISLKNLPSPVEVWEVQGVR